MNWNPSTKGSGLTCSSDVTDAYGPEDLIFQSPDDHASIEYISPFPETRADRSPRPFNLTRVDPSSLDREAAYLQVRHIYHPDSFMSIDPRALRSLGIVTKKFYLGGTGYYGIIDCKSYKGDMNGYSSNPRSLVIHADGLQLPRIFYSPTYATPAQKASRSPDFRTLLFWDPALSTGTAGARDIGFYSSDAAGQYVAVIQGISSQGHPAVARVYFSIKK